MGHSPKDLKQTNSLATRGISILVRELENQTKASQSNNRPKKMPNPQSKDNISLFSDETKCPGTQQQCQTEGKPLVRVAMVNNMLYKTTAGNEVFLLK